MNALPSDKWRAFVIALFDRRLPSMGQRQPPPGPPVSARPPPAPIVMARYAHRVMQDPRMQRALMEESKKLLRAHAPEAVNALLAIVRDVRHKDHARGVQMLLDRTDSVELHSTVHHQVEINHTDEALRELAFLKKHRRRPGCAGGNVRVFRAWADTRRCWRSVNAKQVSAPGPDQPRRPRVAIEGEAVEVEVKPAAAPKDPGLPGEASLRGDRW